MKKNFRQSSPKIINVILIRRIVKHYLADEFKEMQEEIDSYGTSNFFLDLSLYLVDQSWTYPMNRYAFYVGISQRYWHYQRKTRQAN